MIVARAPRAHFNALRCEALAGGCCRALGAAADAAAELSEEDPVRYRVAMEALLEALEVSGRHLRGLCPGM